MSDPVVRLIIVDDSAVVRTGLRALLALDPRIEIVAEAEDGDQALSAVAEHRPDVVLLDVRMPRRDGLSVVAEIADQARVVMLTFTDDEPVIHRAIQDGAVGYLVHGTFDADSLGSMVRSAAAGTGPFSGPALAVLRRGAPTPDRAAVRAGLGLSERQGEVMDLIAAGLTNQEVARRLFLAEKTVKNHINQIFAMLGATSRGQAIAVWLGTTTPDDGGRGPR